jgi:hypothetical protein
VSPSWTSELAFVSSLKCSPSIRNYPVLS